MTDRERANIIVTRFADLAVHQPERYDTLEDWIVEGFTQQREADARVTNQYRDACIESLGIFDRMIEDGENYWKRIERHAPFLRKLLATAIREGR